MLVDLQAEMLLLTMIYDIQFLIAFLCSISRYVFRKMTTEGILFWFEILYNVKYTCSNFLCG